MTLTELEDHVLNRQASSSWGLVKGGILSSMLHFRPEQVPHRFWFTYKTDIIETKTPANVFRNLAKTISIYHTLWKEPDVPAECLTDEKCIDLISRVEPRLVSHFLNEDRGSFRGDICRIAALYLYGGYYFNVDLEVIKPVQLDEGSSIQFATIYNEERAFFFQAFIASTPEHPVIASALDLMLEFYEGTLVYRYDNHNMEALDLMGCITLYYAYEDYVLQENERHLLLKESNPFDKTIGLGDSIAHSLTESNVQSRLELGKDCNHLVEDVESDHSVYFWSRIVGSGICQGGDKALEL